MIAVTRRALRGAIVDRDGRGSPERRRRERRDVPRLPRRTVSPVVGYLSRQFGSAGLERAYDAELRGVQPADPVDDLLKKFDADRPTRRT